jgi:demethylmenaquinone methyltransferase/2-methoxy-6-polyprenyl-1,4-benzoquinol methylase
MSETPSAERLGSGAMFDAIAGRYDLLNRLMSFGIDKGWRKKAVRALGLPSDQPSRVLDVATGTADLALMTCSMCPTASVVGVDPSTGMLAVGEKKIAEAGLTDRITLSVGDAQALPFEANSFDGATIAFGIRNVPDRVRGIAEMTRVVKVGARVVVLELSEPRGFMSAFSRAHIHHVVPWLGGLVSGKKEYSYLQASIAAFPPAEAFAELMRGVGLEIESVAPMTMGVAHLYVGVKRSMS